MNVIVQRVVKKVLLLSSNKLNSKSNVFTSHNAEANAKPLTLLLRMMRRRPTLVFGPRTDRIKDEFFGRFRTTLGRLVRSAAGRGVRGHFVEIGTIAIRVGDLWRTRRRLRLLLQHNGRRTISGGGGGGDPHFMCAIIVVMRTSRRRVVGEFARWFRTARLVVLLAGGVRMTATRKCTHKHTYTMHSIMTWCESPQRAVYVLPGRFAGVRLRQRWVGKECSAGRAHRRTARRKRRQRRMMHYDAGRIVQPNGRFAAIIPALLLDFRSAVFRRRRRRSGALLRRMRHFADVGHSAWGGGGFCGATTSTTRTVCACVCECTNC